jgi:acid phosphatase type 7
VLYAANVDVVINGHDHTYERFAPQDPDGRLDPAHGIREFVVGTGGSPLYELPSAVEGQTFHDSGAGICH